MNMRRALAVALVACFLAACTSTKQLPPGAGGDQPLVTVDPTQLVGSWKVLDAHAATGTSVILGDQLSLFLPCGLMQGSWSADRYGDFIGAVSGGDQRCFADGAGPPDVPWLRQALFYRIDGSDRLLLNAARHVVARLSPGAHPHTGPNDAPTFASPPAVTPDLRNRLEEPAPFPAGMTAAMPVHVLGRWRATGRDAGNPAGFVEFGRGGAWTGSDGCNAAGGRYAIGQEGELITTNGASTLIGCNGSPAPYWVEQARRVAFEHGDLVLFDRTGKELGVLAKAT